MYSVLKKKKKVCSGKDLPKKKSLLITAREPGKVCGIRRCCSRANDITRREHYLWLQSGINLVTAESAQATATRSLLMSSQNDPRPKRPPAVANSRGPHALQVLTVLSLVLGRYGINHICAVTSYVVRFRVDLKQAVISGVLNDFCCIIDAL